MGESTLVALIAGAVTVIGVGVTSIFAFAGRKAELAQRAFERELERLREQIVDMRAERDHYRDRLEDLRLTEHPADHRRWADAGNHDQRRKRDNGNRRRFDDDAQR